jgi:hypothetical protein
MSATPSLPPETPARLFTSQTALGGMLLIAISALALFLLRDLTVGSLAEIGPGFFPRTLAVFVAFMGFVMVTLGVRENRVGGGEQLEGWSPRQIIAILGAIILFGMTIRGMTIGPVSVPALGLVIAAPLALLFSGLADPDTRWRDMVVLALVLTVGTVLLFRFTLGLPIPVAPWLIGY